MSFNITDLIKDQLSDQVTGQLGSLLGGSDAQNGSAIASAIPGLLSGLMNSGSSSSGADSLFNAINDQDDSILDNLGGLLGGSGQSSMMSAGSSILGSLLGGGNLGSLVSSIAGFSGAGKGSVKSLLGLLAPIIFGVIKRKLMGGSGDFNVGSLMDMFKGQKDNIAASMPSGFQLNDFSSNATEAVRETVNTAQTEGKSMLGKLLPLALLIGVALLAYNFFMKDKGSEAVNSATTSVIQSNNIGKEVTSVFGSLTGSLGSITDAASAKAALPQIGEATDKLGNIAGMLDKLPAAAQAPVKSAIASSITPLKALIDKVGAIPGVGDVIKPAIEGLAAKLALFQ
ncbi:MAG: DUF937 domain-containing protein [Cocleimonas sp.]|nr:DUF937 domain-containing protein [Cocleimonas sp.]